MDKSVVHSCGHKGKIDVEINPLNEKAWRYVYEITPCNSCILNNKIHAAIKNAKDMCDELVDGLPGFRNKKDADACADLLGEETGKHFYVKCVINGLKDFYVIW